MNPVEEALQALTARERLAVRYRYGNLTPSTQLSLNRLFGFEIKPNYSVQEISRILGLSLRRTKKILSKALAKLSAHHIGVVELKAYSPPELTADQTTLALPESLWEDVEY